MLTPHMQGLTRFGHHVVGYVVGGWVGLETRVYTGFPFAGGWLELHATPIDRKVQSAWSGGCCYGPLG